MRLHRICILLTLFLSLVSCQSMEKHTRIETILPSAAETLPETENKVHQPADEITVTDIRSSVSPDAAFPAVEEPFWKDDAYLYGFVSPISEYIIVEYSDGSMQNVKEALADGKIQITDLDAYGISYFTEPRLIENIIYHSDRGGAAEALEVFYEDSGYTYSFPSIRSDVVIVYYTDGTEKPIREALADGSVRIRDLDWFGIKYYKDKKETRPSGYGSGVAAFDSIREMIRQIENGELNWADQEIYDAHGCDIAELRELTGMDEGFSEYLVEWCGGLNYSLCYHIEEQKYDKEKQHIAFMPFYTQEAFEQSLSGMDTYESLAENELILNLVKTDLDTEEGIMYACTYDTSKVKGLRMTYHDTIGEDGIRRIVTNQYNTNGKHDYGSIYTFDEEVPFCCVVRGFEADMEFAMHLGTKYIMIDCNSKFN